MNLKKQVVYSGKPSYVAELKWFWKKSGTKPISYYKHLMSAGAQGGTIIGVITFSHRSRLAKA